jgi:hypothetical protein
MKFFGLFLLCFMLFSSRINGQKSQHLGVFPTIDHSGILTNKIDYSFYYFGAFNLINSRIDGVKEPSNFFALYGEQAITYNVNAGLSFTGSYVFERQHPVESNFRSENRFYLQSTYKYNLKRTTLKHRFRFDGRYIENRLTKKSPFTSRIRYLFGIKGPLDKMSNKLYYSVYNEFFFNLDKSATAIYGENWAYAGLGLNLNAKNSIELGLLNIFWVNNKQNDLTQFYYLQLAWVNQLDFRKEKK